MRCSICEISDDNVIRIGIKSSNGEFLCRQCGSVLQQDVVQVVATTANIATVDDVYSTQLGAMADIFGGDDLREMIEAFISESSLTNTRKISVMYLNTLGKLLLDYPRQAVLYDITLRIGPLKIFAMSATFGFLPESFPFQVGGPLVLGDPIFGESELINSSNNLQGAMVVLQRGVVSFASKAQRALRAGATALVVLQTVDTWPFTMADAAKELPQEQMITGGGLAIPVIMISKKDSEMVLKMISSTTSSTTSTTTTTTSTATITTASTSTSTSTINSTTTTSSTTGTTINSTSDRVSNATTAGLPHNACVHYSNFAKDCSICQEVFCPSDELVNVELLKLPCRHVYHSHCVMEWLKKNNTCPLCRLALPSEEDKRNENAAGHGRREVSGFMNTYYN